MITFAANYGKVHFWHISMRISGFGIYSYFQQRIAGISETGVPAIDMSYNEGANCCISSAGFDKSCKETHSLLTDGTYGSKVSDCIFDNLSFPRSIVPFKNLRFNTTNTAILQILSSLNTMLPEKRLSHTCFDVNYTKYSCKYYVYTLAHILI